MVAAIYVRIYVDSRKATFSTRFYVNPKHWDNKAGKLRHYAPNYQQINAFIDRSCNQILQDYLNCVARGEFITAQKLKNNFLGIKSGPEERTLLEAITFHNDKFLELTKSGQAAHSTWKKDSIFQMNFRIQLS